jgi:hypothetical protein
LLTNATNQDSTFGNPSPTKNHKPPPIFVHGVINYGEMIKRIRDVAEDEIKEINWLIGRKSHLSIENKVLIYKAIIKPIWSYGIELWGCASKSHIVIMQRTQSKILRAIANAPWYVTNHILHSDLKVPYIRDVIHE